MVDANGNSIKKWISIIFLEWMIVNKKDKKLINEKFIISYACVISPIYTFIINLVDGCV